MWTSAIPRYGQRHPLWLILTLLSLAAVTCDVPLNEGPSSDDWERYESPNGTFSVSYPANFEPYHFDSEDLQESFGPLSDDGSFTMFANESPGAGSGAISELLGGQWAGTELRMGVMSLGDMEGLLSAKDFAHLLRKDYRRAAGYREIQFESTELGGLRGTDWTFETTGTLNAGTEVQQTARYVFLDGGGTLYMIAVGALSSTYGDEVSVIDRFVSSFST